MVKRETDQRPTEELLEVGRAWARTYTPFFETIIEKVTRQAVELLEKRLPTQEAEIARARVLVPNPFARPLCHALIRAVPDELLPTGMSRHMFHTIYLKNGGLQVGYRHSDLTMGVVHIDPQFGQYFPAGFERTVEQNPHLFEGHILVATQQDIQKAFGITYEG